MVDITLFITFLAINFTFGLFHSRQVATMRDYSVGRKNFSTATLVATIIATHIGGGFLFRYLEYIYLQGLYYIIPTLVGGSGYVFIVGRFLTLRMGEFLDTFSIAEAMGRLYGRTVRVITGVSGVLREGTIIGMQFWAMGKAFKLVFNLAVSFNIFGYTVELEGEHIGVLVLAPIVITYAAFGGIRAVTFTDVLQFLTFFVFVPILTLIVWNKFQDPHRIVHVFTTNSNFSFKDVLQWDQSTASMLRLMFFFMIPTLLPSTYQRIVMARDVYQARRSFTYATSLELAISLFVTVVGILLVAENAQLNPKAIVDHLINNYSYPGLKGLIAVGIVAMAMSTADSLLNAAAVLAVHDIIKPLHKGFKESIVPIRVFAFLLGVCSLFLALTVQDLMKLVLLSGLFFSPIVDIPSLLAIFGFRSSTRAVLIGMSAGFVVVTTQYFWFGGDMLSSIILGIAANLLFFMGSHYLLREQGGWVGIKEPAPLLAEREKARLARKALIENFKKPQLYTYLKKNLPAQDGFYSLFGVYVIGATYALFFTIPDSVVTDYRSLYEFIIISVLLMIVVFITYPAWPPILRDKRFITFFWPLGVGYLLFFVGANLVLMSGYNEVQVMIFMLNLLIATLLLSWPLVVGLAASGVLLACAVWYLQTGSLSSMAAQVPLQFKLIYSMLMFSSCWFALIRFRQAKFSLEEQKDYSRTKDRELRTQLIETLGYRREILQEFSKDELALLDSTALPYMRQAIYRVTDYLRLELSEISLEQLLEDTRTLLALQDFKQPPHLITKWHTDYKTLRADVSKIKQLLVDSIVYIQKNNPAHRSIAIGLEPAKLGYQLEKMPNYTRKLAALKITITTSEDLPPTEGIYMLNPMQTAIQKLAKVTDPSLLENIRIIDVHYGYADVSKATTHIYVIPINVKKIRGKVMELLQTSTEANPEEIKHPLAIQLEGELLGKLAGTSVDLAVIRHALDTIKKYHGGVRGKSGEPFFTHPLATAIILTDYSQDQEALVAALLHDTVENTSLSLDQVRVMFGETVALLVSKAHNLEDEIKKVKLKTHKHKHRSVNYGDPRAALIKLADRLHNMRTIGGHSSLDKQKQIAEETLNFFVPIAKQLNLTAMIAELEQLSRKISE